MKSKEPKTCKSCGSLIDESVDYCDADCESPGQQEVKDERDYNRGFVDGSREVIARDQENERLKGLIYYNYKSWFVQFYRATSQMAAREIHDFFVEEVAKFKIENNL